VAKKKQGTSSMAAHVNEPKVAMSYRLSPARIARAQKILGAATATATIEEALDAVIFRRELMESTRRAFGLPVVDAFPDAESGLRR
jgi:uncharacterized NAD-dependent epimerase/dehydratase family protein